MTRPGCWGTLQYPIGDGPGTYCFDKCPYRRTCPTELVRRKWEGELHCFGKGEKNPTCKTCPFAVECAVLGWMKKKKKPTGRGGLQPDKSWKE